MQAQTFTVLHTFTGANDGGKPAASLTLDGAGNLYGTASYGGGHGMGTVFKLTNRPSGWTLANLYSFTGGSDGAKPNAGVIFGPDGSLYGNTYAGGNPACEGGCGTVYNLKPPPRVCSSTSYPWQETTLYQFPGGPDGGQPMGNLSFDSSGNLYGTTISGEGAVFEMSPGSEGWTYHPVFVFDYHDIPSGPYAGVIPDAAGNLFGTTVWGGENECYQLITCGTIFELSPVGSSWRLQVLHEFDGSDGGNPMSGLIFDRFGNLYGANTWGGVFNLTPSAGNWTFNLLYRLSGLCLFPPGSLCGPLGSLAIDATGALYGTQDAAGAYGYGSVFKLTPSNGGWIYTDLHDFTGGSDGEYPAAGVTLDANGNVYGTAEDGGSSGFGVVFEITP